MITPNYYWTETDEKFEKILQLIKNPNNSVMGILIEERLLKDNPFYFGRIADYIAVEYGYENTFSRSEWDDRVFEKLHEQCHDFLSQTPIDSSICKYASHKSALRFLGFFPAKGDLLFLTNYLKSSHYKITREELQDFFLWTLTKVIQHNLDSPSQELMDWIVDNVDKDWLIAYRARIIGYTGHYSQTILKWAVDNFTSLTKTEQEEVLIGAIAVESKTLFYETIFEKIPQYVEQNALNKDRNSYYKLYYIQENISNYISEVEKLQPYSSEKELLSLPTIHTDYYLKRNKEKLFSLILLESNIAIEAKISLFIKIIKHRKKYTFFIPISTYNQFIFLLKNKLEESQELILPEQYEIEEGLEKIEKLRSKVENSISE